MNTKHRIALAALAAGVVIAGLALAACGGGGEKEKATPTALETPAAQETNTPATSEATTTPEGTLTPGATEQGTARPEVQVVAKDMAFSTRSIDVAANEPFSVIFDNQDDGIEHNFAVYRDEGATDLVAKTEITAGPVVQELSVSALPAGTYYFRDDAHAAEMHGELVVS